MLYQGSTGIFRFLYRQLKKEHNEEEASSSNSPYFSLLKTFVLFQFLVVFRVLINLEN